MSEIDVALNASEDRMRAPGPRPTCDSTHLDPHAPAHPGGPSESWRTDTENSIDPAEPTLLRRADSDFLENDPGAPQRTVLGRIATIMEAFQGGPRVLSLGELSRRTGLPKSTLHRLAVQLCDVGWIERDPGGYRIGIGLFELGSLAVEGTRLHKAAFPHLQSLSAKTGMAAQLAILDGSEVVYLDRIAPHTFRLPTRRGGRKPAYCTGLGKALVAFDDDALDAVVTAEMPRRTANTITEPSSFHRELTQIRKAGIAFDRGEAHDGLVCVAAPIRKDGRAIAAVSVTGPSSGMRWGAATDAVRNTAAAIWNATFSVGPARARARA